MRVTLRDIAKELSLSHATVSFVLNDRRDVSIPESTRARVMETAKKLGYKPNRAARALAKGESDLVAFWVPPRTLSNFWKLSGELERQAVAHQMEVVVRTATFSAEEINSVDLEDWPIAGTILLDCARAPWISGITQLDHPVVSIGMEAVPSVDSVVFDYEAASVLVAEHLASQGVTRVVHASLMALTDPDELRKKWLKSALQERGIELETVLCVDGSRAGVKSALVHHIRNSDIPAAIIADTDSAAIACMRAIYDLGFAVPYHTIVIGFGGSDESEVSLPSLSTVAFSATEAVEKAWRLLEIKRMGGSKAPVVERIHPRLIVRESSSKLR